MKIAVIDDIKSICDNWVSALTENGERTDIEVHTYAHHMELIRAVDENPSFGNDFDLMIVDRMVPRFDAIRDRFIFEYRYICLEYNGITVLSTSLGSPKSRDSMDGYDFFTTKEAKSLPKLKQVFKRWIKSGKYSNYTENGYNTSCEYFNIAPPIIPKPDLQERL